MKPFLQGEAIPRSRHPHILYWMWAPAILEGEKYLQDLQLVAEEGVYTTVILTARDGMNFWAPELYPHLDAAARYAHQLGLKIVLQLWPEGFFDAPLMPLEPAEAVALVNEGECTVTDGTAYYCDSVRHVCKADVATVLSSELLKVYAFRKASEDTYFDGTLQDVTEQAVLSQTAEGRLELRFTLPDMEGATLYILTAHYLRYGDLFSDFYLRDYESIIERYRDTPFDGIVLDEMKNVELQSFEFTGDPVMVRERFYGKHFKACFEAETGENLEQTLFEMRYTARSETARRPAAINRYYDILRRATRRIERFVADKSRSIYGDDAFLGLHNTFHNHLQNDELISTGINWWEVPRRYAQTDEDIPYPVRMGIACQCPEALIYDMYYEKTVAPFLEKAMRDAKFGSRLHYHAMNDGFWGVDTGSRAFMQTIRSLESKIELLNLFEPTLPAMELLVVFGFPALCNWYPDVRARNAYDINGSLNIMERVDALWKAGYLNALAPSDALEDGRIVLSQTGEFVYCGHTFKHMLFLYPEYAKRGTLHFLEQAIEQGASLRIIGGATMDFDCRPHPPALQLRLGAVTVPEWADIPQLFALHRQTIEDGCVLEDGAVVFSDLESLQTHQPRRFSVQLGGHTWQGAYEGVAAIRADADGQPVRIVCGGCRHLCRDDEVLFADAQGADIALL